MIKWNRLRILRWYDLLFFHSFPFRISRSLPNFTDHMDEFLASSICIQDNIYTHTILSLTLVFAQDSKITLIEFVFHFVVLNDLIIDPLGCWNYTTITETSTIVPILISGLLVNFTQYALYTSSGRPSEQLRDPFENIRTSWSNEPSWLFINV